MYFSNKSLAMLYCYCLVMVTVIKLKKNFSNILIDIITLGIYLLLF